MGQSQQTPFLAYYIYKELHFLAACVQAIFSAHSTEINETWDK